MDPVQCKAEFRVDKNALRSVAEALLISDTAYLTGSAKTNAQKI